MCHYEQVLSQERWWDWNIKISRAYSVNIKFGENLGILDIQSGVNLLNQQ